MRLFLSGLVLGAAMLTAAAPAVVRIQSQTNPKGQRLADLAWPEAERLLTPDAVVVIPLGAGSKEHGPHLKLGNDSKLAEYLTGRIVESTAVIVAPTVAYHYYPAFLEYPGSTSLTLDTARDSVMEVVRTLAHYGPKRFYVLNTGISTARALDPAAAALASDGILLRYTALGDRLERAARGIREQAGGTHADEVETSMMLYIDPSSVDMSRAVKDYSPARATPSAPAAFKLTRTQGGEGTYSASGVWGDPTLATREKGHAFVEALVSGIAEDIQSLRTAALPPRTQMSPAQPAPVQPATPAPVPESAPGTGDRCSPQAFRSIMAIGDTFAAAWANHSAVRLGGLWSDAGNIIHTDGTIETGSKVITQNRIILFGRPEYRGSRHSLQFTLVRCLAENIAVADGRWEMRNLRDAGGRPAPPMEGRATAVVKRSGDTWLIEAYRYTVAGSK
jgi:creatinine amidohydrolase